MFNDSQIIEFNCYTAFIVVIVLQPLLKKIQRTFRISRCYSGIEAVSRTATKF